MKLQNLTKKTAQKPLNLLIANKGKHIYYVQFTDELLLSTEKFVDGNLIITFGKKEEIELGPVTYVGDL